MGKKCTLIALNGPFLPFLTVFLFCIDCLLETQHSSDFLNSNHYSRNTVAGEVIRECIDYSQHDSTLIRGRNCTNERGRLDRSIIIFLTSNIYNMAEGILTRVPSFRSGWSTLLNAS